MKMDKIAALPVRTLMIYAIVIGSLIGSLDIFGLDMISKCGPVFLTLAVAFFLLKTKWAKDSSVHQFKKLIVSAFAMGFCMAFGSGMISFTIGVATGFSEVMLAAL